MTDDAPSPLSNSDERLVELLRARRPDAEISVKLGLSVSELRIRIGRLAARLGVSGREGLAAWTPGDSARLASHRSVDDYADWAPVIGARNVAEDEPESGKDEAAVAPAKPHRFSRRAMLGLLAGGAVTVAGGGYLAATRGGGGSSEGSFFTTPGPIQAATPDSRSLQPTIRPRPGGFVPEPTARPLGTFDAASNIIWTEGVEPFVLTSYAAGEPIAARTGVYFMDPETGSLQGFDGEPDADINPLYMVSPGSRFVAFNGTNTGHILDLSIRRVGTWRTDEMALIELGSDMALFGEAKDSNTFGPVAYELISLTDISGFEAAKVFRLDSRLDIRDVNFSERGRPVHVLYTYQNDNGIVSIPTSEGRRILTYSFGSDRDIGFTPRSLVETRPGNVTVVASDSEVADGGAVSRRAAIRKLSNQWEANVRASVEEPRTIQVPQPDGTTRTVLVDPLNTDKVPLFWSSIPEASIVDLSPDGRLVAWEQVEREVVPDEVDAFSEAWLSVVVADAETLKPKFRVRSASLRYGDFVGESRWLANSSGIVVEVRPNQAGERFAIVAADGSGLERLPLAPVEPDVWYRRPSIYAPVPSPSRPELLAYGKLSTYNRETGEWRHANMVSEEGPKHFSPWASGGEELVFSPDHGGHGGTNTPIFLPPQVEFVPFNDAMLFEVVVDTCLNLREEPTPDATILDCLEPGNFVGLLPGSKVTADRFSVAYHESGTYVLVQSPSGRPGWVALRYLEWATGPFGH